MTQQVLLLVAFVVRILFDQVFRHFRFARIGVQPRRMRDWFSVRAALHEDLDVIRWTDLHLCRVFA